MLFWINYNPQGVPINYNTTPNYILSEQKFKQNVSKEKIDKAAVKLNWNLAMNECKILNKIVKK